MWIFSSADVFSAHTSNGRCYFCKVFWTQKLFRLDNYMSPFSSKPNRDSILQEKTFEYHQATFVLNRLQVCWRLNGSWWCVIWPTARDFSDAETERNSSEVLFNSVASLSTFDINSLSFLCQYSSKRSLKLLNKPRRLLIVCNRQFGGKRHDWNRRKPKKRKRNHTSPFGSFWQPSQTNRCIFLILGRTVPQSA